MTVDIESLSALQLLQLNAKIIARLKIIGATRTSNATGDYAEHLCAKAFGWTLENNSNAGFDAVHDGVRVQIKCRRPTISNPSRQLGEFSKFETKKFDLLAAVLFAEDFTVLRAAIIPWDVIDRLAYDVQGRRRFYLRDAVWHEPDVEDVTSALRGVQTAL